MAAKEWTDNKMFQFRNGLLWTQLGGIASYGQKKFGESINFLCKVSTAQTMRKRNDCLSKILFPVVGWLIELEDKHPMQTRLLL